MVPRDRTLTPLSLGNRVEQHNVWELYLADMGKKRRERGNGDRKEWRWDRRERGGEVGRGWSVEEGSKGTYHNHY